MNQARAVSAEANSAADAMLHALPHPVLMVSPDGKIADANVAAEQFFEASIPMLRRHMLRDLVPFGSPLLAFQLVDSGQIHPMPPSMPIPTFAAWSFTRVR